MIHEDSDSPLPFPLRALRADETLRSTTEPAALRRRHRILAHLESRGGTARVSQLVEALAVADGEPLGSADEAPLERDRYRLRTRLVHVDLPRLADAGAVAYDAAQGTVRLVEVPDWYRPERN